jgi:hypothetical protein
MSPLDLVRLAELMEKSFGNPEVGIGLIDGPIAVDHPALNSTNIREIPSGLLGSCSKLGSTACKHGTFVAGILLGRRGSATQAICPGCTLLSRSIFSEVSSPNDLSPIATPNELGATRLAATLA